MPDEPWVKEYYTVLDIIRDFDKSALTIKGWATTVSLALIGVGFAQGHYGLFLAAC